MAFGSMTEDGSMMALGSGWTLLPFARALSPFSWHGEQAPQWPINNSGGRELALSEQRERVWKWEPVDGACLGERVQPER